MKEHKNSDVRSRIKSTYSEAINHFLITDLYVDDGTYTHLVDEYRAGLEVLDRAIAKDSDGIDTSVLKTIRSSLQKFHGFLDDDSLRKLKVGYLIDDLDALHLEASAS